MSDNKTILESVVEAFEALDFEVWDQETTIEHWVGDCAISRVNWNSGGSCRLTTVIWGHPTVITGETVTIYAPPDG